MHGQAETFLLEKNDISSPYFSKIFPFNVVVFFITGSWKSILFNQNFYVLEKFIKQISTFITNNFYSMLIKESVHDIIFFFESRRFILSGRLFWMGILQIAVQFNSIQYILV